jgi:putative transcriptional regulator
MKKELFEELLESLREAGAIERGEMEPAKVTRFPVINTKVVRQSFGATQAEFSRMIGVPLATLRNWEQGRRHPDGPARVLLLVAARYPEAVKTAVAELRGVDVTSWARGENVLQFARPIVASRREQENWAATSETPELAVDLGRVHEPTSATA